jgi:hypothetical protein
VQVTNPADVDDFHGDHVMTRNMRVGELWLLGWDPKTKKINTFGLPGAGRLTGLNDPSLRMFSMVTRWQRIKDPDKQFDAITRVAFDDRQHRLVRNFAFGLALTSCYGQNGRAPSGARVGKYYHLISETLSRSDAPAFLQKTALENVRVNALSPIPDHSDEATLLNRLIQILDKSTDAELVRVAAVRAFDANLQHGPFVDGKMTVYLFPDLLAALERRSQKEQAERPGKAGPATGLLNNLSLVGRRSPDQAAKGGAHVVLRPIPLN